MFSGLLTETTTCPDSCLHLYQMASPPTLLRQARQPMSLLRQRLLPYFARTESQPQTWRKKHRRIAAVRSLSCCLAILSISTVPLVRGGHRTTTTTMKARRICLRRLTRPSREDTLRSLSSCLCGSLPHDDLASSARLADLYCDVVHSHCCTNALPT